MGGYPISIDQRRFATRLALGATIVLTVLKFWAAAFSRSVGVFSEGIHSLLDVVSAALAFYTVRQAVKPADADHPWGHGKFETLSSLFESLLLTIAAIWIVVESLSHFKSPHDIAHPQWSIVVMVISVGVSYWVYRNNIRAARLSDSLALHANALHFLADILTSLGVLVGLVIIYLFKWNWIDPVIALLVALYIFQMTFKQLKVTLAELSDVQLPEGELSEIKAAVSEFQNDIVGSHDFRTRKSGITRHVDFHLDVCGQMTVDESHRICDQVEEKIIGLYPHSLVNIHVEPCNHDRTLCETECLLKSKRELKLRPKT